MKCNYPQKGYLNNSEVFVVNPEFSAPPHVTVNGVQVQLDFVSVSPGLLFLSTPEGAFLVPTGCLYAA